MNHCSVVSDTIVKDLSKLGRSLSNLIIVDNSPSAYMLQPENAMPISTWVGNKADRELYDLIPVLEKLSRVKDTREVIRKFFKIPQSVINNSLLLKSKAERYLPRSSTNLQPDINYSESVRQIRPKPIPIHVRLNRGHIELPKEDNEPMSVVPSTTKGLSKLVPFVNNKPVNLNDLKLKDTIDQKYCLEYRIVSSSSNLFKNDKKKRASIYVPSLSFYNNK